MDQPPDIGKIYCPNKNCPDFSILGKDNIAVRGKYGKNKDKILFYCRTCGHRFGQTHGSALFGAQIDPETIRSIIHHAAEGVSVRSTARLLNIDKSTVNRIILRIGEHCSKILSNLLRSIYMTEVQLDEFWSFVKKKKLLRLKQKKDTKEQHGSGLDLM
jgi:transposase-like protein